MEGNAVPFFYFLIGVAVALADFLLGNPIDWWFVILAFLCSFASHVVYSGFFND